MLFVKVYGHAKLKNFDFIVLAYGFYQLLALIINYTLNHILCAVKGKEALEKTSINISSTLDIIYFKEFFIMRGNIKFNAEKELPFR